MSTYRCDICGRVIPTGLPPLADSRYHDPAYHVAKAYHVPGQFNLCVSDGHYWPCPTSLEYTPVGAST